MSFKNIDNYGDWIKRFFGNNSSTNRDSTGIIRRGGGGLFDTNDIFGEFDDIQEEVTRMFNTFNDISTNAPKELVREYQTDEGEKVRKVGPIVYGYSMTVGPDGKPHVREFGNVKSFGSGNKGSRYENKPQISAEREPLADVNSTENEVKVILELPGIKKEEIKINAFEGSVEVIADNNNAQRKYHKTIELPQEANIETARSTYNNGILEVTFDKSKKMKPKGKEIKIE